ncbi:MAG: hypothetical protein EHM47_14720 [Ignavibacteriales bacterium]|nr:MAG: hypothetical protein EHM47_14720 [Ignavibacteriales bacterium]
MSRVRLAGTILKAWVPACSTGESAFTLAILFQEAVKNMNTKTRLRIIATDINTSRLEYTKKAIRLQTMRECPG